MAFAVFFSVPAILLKPIGDLIPLFIRYHSLRILNDGVFFSISAVDYTLVKWGLFDREYQITNIMKRFIARSVLLISGIDVVQEGLDSEVGAQSYYSSLYHLCLIFAPAKYMKKTSTLAFYSHGSTLDPFMIGAYTIIPFPPSYHRVFGPVDDVFCCFAFLF